MFPINVCVSSNELPNVVEPDNVAIDMFVTDEDTMYCCAVKLPDIRKSPISLPVKSNSRFSEPVLCNKL
jgi:hypothetical protein